MSLSELSGLDARQLDAMIASIDRSISKQIDEILHHPEFQKLEATWAGIKALVAAVPTEFERASSTLTLRDDSSDDETSEDGIVLSVLNVSKETLLDDLRYSNPRRSAFFRKIYREPYNVFGGIPFTLLVGDYEFSGTAEDCFLLREISRVVSESFTVFVAAASPDMFHLDSFRGFDSLGRLEHGDNYGLEDRLSDQVEWNNLRNQGESKFIALTLPKIIGRRPYDYRRGLGIGAKNAGWRDEDRACLLKYRESKRIDHSHLLWVNAAFAFAATVVTCYAKYGWLADIHGIPEEGVGGGIVPWPEHEIDRCLDSTSSDTFKPLTEILVSDKLEKELSDLGFLALCHRHLTDTAVFCTTPSIHAPSDPQNPDQKLSSLLQYTLCVARFAHAIKRLGHHKVGKFLEADGIKGELRNFLSQYVITNAEAPKHKKAEKPLRAYQLKVSQTPGQEGRFDCDITLQMHHELDAVQVELKTQLTQINSAVE